MPEKVFVTGIGIVSAIGNNLMQSIEALKASESGVSVAKYVNTKHKDVPLAEVKLSNDEILNILNIEGKNLSRTALLGLLAANEAFCNKSIQNKSIKTGLISATTVGGLTLKELFLKQINDGSCKNEVIESLSCADSTQQIAGYLEIKDYLSTISTACSSSSNSIMNGCRLIKNKILDRVLVGGTDTLSRFTINGFKSLEILSKEQCKPFDADRNGINLGEGAAYLLLESESIADKNSIICEAIGYGNANDAFHQTASSPEGKGAYLAMQKALKTAGISAGEIDYINAHGTGTEINDISEGRAIMKTFNNNVPSISSTKAFTGHTLAAAGAIEAIIAILAMKNSFIPENLNFKNKIEELSFTPNTIFKENVEIRNVLSNSFGFGGNNTSIIFSNIQS